jgi:phage-related tail fiber protein
MLATTDLKSRLDDVRGRIAACRRAVDEDTGASVVTAAVVREFDTKADKAMASADDAKRDAIIELEQAADSARAAANADPDLGTAALEAVEDAHLSIYILKTEV